MKKSFAGLVFSLVACAASSASATTYYSKESGTKNVSIVTAIKWYTDVKRTTEANPQPTPAAGDGNEYVFIGSSKVSSSTFTGKAYFGCDGTLVGSSGASCGISCNNATFDFSDLTLVRGYWACNANTRATFTGAMTVAPGCSFEFRGSSSEKDKSRGVTVKSTLTGATDSILAFKGNLSNTTATNGVYSYNVLTIAGDASGFRGKYSVSHSWLSGNAPDEQWSEICLGSASAFGDPTAIAADAVKLTANTYISITGTVNQTANRGITISCSKDTDVAGVRAWKYSSNDWTLTAPVVCAKGIFAKTGDGTVHLAGSVQAANVEVRAGTLVLDATYTASEGQTILVRNGARLILLRSAAGLNLTNEGEGELITELTIPYDDSTKSATALSVANDYFSDAAEINVELSESIAIPFVATNRLKVLEISNGTIDVSRFVDATPKTCALPTTWFESETDESTLLQTVYLVAKPVMQGHSNGARISLASWTQSGQTYYSWTDELKDHLGADYYVTKSPRTGTGSNMSKCDFGGDSLTVNGTAVNDYAGVFTMNDCRIYGTASLIMVVASGNDASGKTVLKAGVRERSIYGNVRLTDGSVLNVYRSNATNLMTWAATLTGTGMLKCYGYTKCDEEGMFTPCKLYDASPDFAGDVCIYAASTNYAIEVGFTNALAFGGSPAKLTTDAVEIDNRVTNRNTVVLIAENDVDVSNPLRGWEVSSGTFRTPSNVTWKMSSPLLVTKQLVKDGAGTLALGSVVTGAGTTFPVAEGYIQPLIANCCANLDLVVSEGAGLRVAMDTGDDVTSYGLRAKSILPETEGGKIAVKIDAPASLTVGTAEVALCTVPSAQTDLADSLTIKPPHSYKAVRIVRTELEGDDAGYVRYSAVIERRGLAFYVK